MQEAIEKLVVSSSNLRHAKTVFIFCPQWFLIDYSSSEPVHVQNLLTEEIRFYSFLFFALHS